MIDGIGKYFERGYPYAGGVAAAFFAWTYAADLALWIVESRIDARALFAAIFDISTILTAFLFAFFGIAVAPGGGFIERIFKTRAFRLFVRYVVEALALGAILTVITVPFMVANIGPAFDAVTANIVFALWAFVCASALLAFYRVASVFFIWLRASSTPFRSRLTVSSAEV